MNLHSRFPLSVHARFGSASLVIAALLFCLLASAMNVQAQQPGWSATGSLATKRNFGHTATLLANGKVLVVGGWGETLGRSNAELYDPATGQWSATGSLKTTRVNHIAVRLANGTVLVAGGWKVQVHGAEISAEIYNPNSGTWSAAASLNVARSGATATLLADGKVLVTGGDTAGGGYGGGLALNTAELYDPAKGGVESRRNDELTTRRGSCDHAATKR